MTAGPLARPPRLRPGDRVVLLAPASPVPPAVLEIGVRELTGWGLRVEIGAHALAGDPALPYLAAPDADRAADLQRAWCDPDVAAVICARGGYGSLRLLDHLDWAAMAAAARQRPRVFAGSSDITALHHAFATRLGVVTHFTPMPATAAFTQDPAARERMRRRLFDPAAEPVITGPAAGTLVPGTATGRTCGGNASVLCSLIGAPGVSGPPPGAVLLLEDITEEPYRLDRILRQLRRAGWLDGLAGIALGSWTDCGEPAEVRATLADTLGDLGVPVAWELGFGHCAAQASVPLGVPAELDADAGTLRLLTPALT